MSKENYEAKLSRLAMMAKDGGDTWDLSSNDQAAIQFALDLIGTLAANVAAAKDIPAEMVIECSAKAIELVNG